MFGAVLGCLDIDVERFRDETRVGEGMVVDNRQNSRTIEVT
jgi:hypothetical protein